MEEKKVNKEKKKFNFDIKDSLENFAKKSKTENMEDEDEEIDGIDDLEDD